MTPGEVRARRVGLGLTQGDVARLMGVDDRQVRRWEAGHEPAPAEMRERYAALLERRDLPTRTGPAAGVQSARVRRGSGIRVRVGVGCVTLDFGARPNCPRGECCRCDGGHLPVPLDMISLRDL